MGSKGAEKGERLRHVEAVWALANVSHGVNDSQDVSKLHLYSVQIPLGRCS